MRRLAAVWILVVVWAASARSARAFDLGNLHLDYIETFAGETALPTTPELNSRGLGAMFASFVGNGGAPGLPQVNQHVRFSMTGVNGTEPSQAQAVAVDARVLGSTNNVAVRATFDSLLLTNVGSALEAVSVGLGFDSAGKVTAPDVALGASLSRVQLPPLDLWALEVDVVSASGLTNVSFQVLPSAIQTAIAAGGSFDLVLRFDRATRQASAAVIAAGQELASTPSVVANTELPLVAVSAAAQVLDSDPNGASTGANDSLRVDLRRFEVHTSAAATPAPGLTPWATWLLSAGLLLLAVRIAARRARQPSLSRR